MMDGLSLLPASFHFLRPEWLLALLPAFLVALLAGRGLRRGRSDWTGIVDTHLLAHLAIGGRRAGQKNGAKAGGGRWPALLLLLGWVLASLAMAGPTWRKLPTPALDRLDPTVLALSLAPGMDMTDTSPSRLVAARHKMEDILQRMRGGQVGFIVYADRPFVAAPLTEDARIIAAMLPELSTDLMPVPQDRPERAITQAIALLQGAGATTGRIVLLTHDAGDQPGATLRAAEMAEQAGYTVSFISIGETSPDAEDALQAAADAGKGALAPMSIDDTDLDTIFTGPARASASNPLHDTGLTADTWQDMGPWLLLPLLVMGALAFRRGWLAGLILALFLPLGAPSALAQEAQLQARERTPQTASTPTSAAPPLPASPPEMERWRNLWQRPDQQGAQAFELGDFSDAAQRFEDPAWRASALYKAGRYEAAAQAYAHVPNADYNRGNALARAGKLEEALTAYDAALAARPDDADALFNRDLIAELLKKQQDEPPPDNGGGPGNSGGSGSQDQQQDSQQQSPQQQDQKQDNQPQESKPEDGENEPQPQKQDAQNPGQPPQPEQQPGDRKDGQEGSNPQKAPQQPPRPDNAPGSDQQQDQNQQEEGKDKQDEQHPPQDQPAQKDQSPPQEPAPAQPADDPQEAGPEQGGPDTAGQKEGADAAGGSTSVNARPMTEQDQNSEQALRMVPDDPSGLLRARIRAYYDGGPVSVGEE
ncbi:tetratricopeptide repeat protein [Xanthobacter sp. TB0139]|uniref:tetratricopeptide repeat protein n=1 Tax=Xanthobacter sp. TB0139 TaxID=3459178 RepID=UPI00403A07C8